MTELFQLAIRQLRRIFLALVKRIIEVHGGQVWVESGGPGQGACFCFALPALRQAA